MSPGRRRRGGAGAPGRQARPADAAVPAPPPPFDPASVEPVAEFAGLGLRAFTTTRTTGTYRLDSTDAVGDVVPRWHGLQTGLGVSRLASARQVHGAEVLLHAGGWRG